MTNYEIKEKNYSFSAGQYFEVKIEHVEMSEEEFNGKLNSYMEELRKFWSEGQQLEAEIANSIGSLKYES